MFAKVSSLGLFGLNAFPVDVEINLSKGLPRFEIVGLADAAVQESRERIKSALYTCGIMFPTSNCIVNLALAGKAGFISREWWPDFCNWRRSIHPQPEEGSIEDAILTTLCENGSMIARELRAACDFVGKNMRSKFDAYVGRLQMGTYIVTEDFVYPVDKHGREYGFGWSLLTTPERLLGREACSCARTPQESYQFMAAHLSRLLPHATEKQISKLLK